MIRDLKAADVEAVCVINKEALGYTFRPEETSSQLAKLSQNPHHFLLGYEDDTSHELVGYIHAEVYESLYSKAGFNILALAVLPQSQGEVLVEIYLKGWRKKQKDGVMSLFD